MPFQPFGYPFEVQSPLPPCELKAAIRARKKNWLDLKNGARGWIAGPFICLWFSAFDQHGPMLIGRISRDKFGAKISGRAGSDLNGLAMACMLMLLMAIMAYVMHASIRQIAIPGAFFLVMMLLVLWSKHAFRREAEPLVRFLNDVACRSGRASSAKSTSAAVSKRFRLNVSGEDHAGPTTPQVIHDALLNLGSGDFVILSTGEEAYIQTASRDGDGFILEKREGSAEQHFQAVRRNGSQTAIVDPLIFTFDEINDAFAAYASDAPMPSYLTWTPMRTP